jgi:hypothetical protein
MWLSRCVWRELTWTYLKKRRLNKETSITGFGVGWQSAPNASSFPAPLDTPMQFTCGSKLVAVEIGWLINVNNYKNWVNYNNSLTWIKAIFGLFPLLTMIIVRSQWGRYNLPRKMTHNLSPPMWSTQPASCWSNLQVPLVISPERQAGAQWLQSATVLSSCFNPVQTIIDPSFFGYKVMPSYKVVYKTMNYSFNPWPNPS